jgi:hypothetical protein
MVFACVRSITQASTAWDPSLRDGLQFWQPRELPAETVRFDRCVGEIEMTQPKKGVVYGDVQSELHR